MTLPDAGAEPLERANRPGDPYSLSIESRNSTCEHDLLRRTAEEVVARSALGEEVEECVGRRYPDAAQDIGVAGEKGVGQHANRRPDDGRRPWAGPAQADVGVLLTRVER